MHSKKIIFTFVTIMSICFAQIPQMINYQGYLSDSDGNGITGTQSVEFLIYAQAGGGSSLWNEIQAITLSNGSFSVLLGSVTPIPANVFNTENCYLAVKVGSDPEMVPRKQITSVGYAFKSGNADSLSGKSENDFVQKGEENSVSNEMIETQYISSINTVGSDGGNISLLPGDHIRMINNIPGKSVTISAVADEIGDNMGDHTATENIKTKGNWISNDGNDKGLFIMEDGKVGVNTDSVGDNYFHINAQFESSTDDIDGHAIFGHATNSEATFNYGGYFLSHGIRGTGVYGKASGDDGDGGVFSASGTTGTGAFGYVSGSHGIGVQGISTGTEASSQFINGQAFSKNIDNQIMWGPVDSYGGKFSASRDNSCGVYSVSYGAESYGVYGEVYDGGDHISYGGYFKSNSSQGYGVYGKGDQYGGYFKSQNDDGRGVYAYASGANSVGLYAYSRNWAGYFVGNVNVAGTISKSAGSFRIDHPQDPENKYLQHSFVESPDMMNLYKGNVILDSDGKATVVMPDYFEALNIEYNYQLTCVGGYAPVYISQEISGNQFEIAGGTAGLKICWEVSGVRNDAYARNHPIEVEVEKNDDEKGKYIFPEDFGKPESMKIGYEEEQKRIQEEKKLEAESRRIE